jgi:hypothetical protein
MLGAVAAGLQWGIVGVALAYTIASVPTRFAFARLTLRTLGVPLGRLVDALSGVAQASLAMALGMAAARAALEAAGAPASVRLASVVALGAALYVPLCLWRVPEVRAELTRLRRERSTLNMAS